MDVTTFGLSRRPFRSHPDPATYCPTDVHEAAVEVVGRAIAAGGGVTVLSGAAGTGKTLVSRKVLDTLRGDAKRVLLQAAPAAGPTEFLQAILFDLEQPYAGLREQELRLAVHAEMLAALADDRPVVVVADEAHHLTPPALEEIRLLGNLWSRDGRAAVVLLVGQSDLVGRVAASSLADRVSAHCRLEPLSRAECVRYVRHQVRECGGQPDRLIGDEAMTLLADHCGGLPRALNRVAAAAFQLAAEAGLPGIDAEAVLDALGRFGMTPAEPDDTPVVLPLRPPAAETPPRPAAVKRKRKTA